jgi:hypothetical protein
MNLIIDWMEAQLRELGGPDPLLTGGEPGCSGSCLLT